MLEWCQEHDNIRVQCTSDTELINERKSYDKSVATRLGRQELSRIWIGDSIAMLYEAMQSPVW